MSSKSPKVRNEVAASVDTSVDLPKIVSEVNAIVTETVASVATAKIAIGRLLNTARAAFYTSKDFDDWREKHTFITSKQDAYYCMQVATRFADRDALIAGTPFSVLKELVSAPDELVKTVEERVAAGEPAPSVREVNKAKAEAKAESKPKPVTGDVIPFADTPRAIPVAATNLAQIKEDTKLLREPLLRRFGLVSREHGHRPGIEQAYIIFGLDPNPSMPPNADTIHILAGAYMQMMNQEDQEIMQEHLNTILEDIDAF